MNRYKLTWFDQLLSLLARRVLGRLPGWMQALLAFLLSFRRRRVIEGKKLDPCLNLMLRVSKIRNPYGLCEPDPVTARERFHREVLIFEGPKTEVDTEETDVEGADGRLPARLYIPRTPKPAGGRRLLLFFHGGGFVIGDIETHDEPCRILCKDADTLVLSVEYRLAPKYGEPHPVNDALKAFDDAVAWAANPEHGADPARVSVGGDSAGGNLSAVIAQQRRNAPRPPSAQLLIYPATDGSKRAESYESRKLYGEGLFITMADFVAFGDHYTGASGVPRDDERVSPLCAKDFGGLPPALVVTADFDLLRTEAEKYLAKMKAAAAAELGDDEAERRFKLLPNETLAHGFINMTGVCQSARDATIRIAEEWRKLLDETGR